MQWWICGCAIAIVAALLVTPRVIELATRLRVLAIPRARDIHKGEIPRWGGLAIVSATLIGALLTVVGYYVVEHRLMIGPKGLGLIVAILIMLTIGMLDDLKDLSPYWQMLGMILAGSILWYSGIRILGFNPPTNGGLRHWIQLAPIISLGITVVWVVAVTKTLDAMDGLDGLAVGVSGICLATMLIIGHLSHRIGGFNETLLAASVGACAGFYKFNAPPAKIFVSSSGGFTLGAILAANAILSTVKGATLIAFVVPVLVLSVPIFDYFIVVTKRLLGGAPLMAADQRHIHHRLLQMGYSRDQVVRIIYFMTFCSCGIAIAMQLWIR